jgi:hypothetical protein
LKTLERVKGIEPSSSAWKAVALPLSYTRINAQSPAIFCFLVGEVEVDFFAIVKPYVEATLIAKREFSEAPSSAN